MPSKSLFYVWLAGLAVLLIGLGLLAGRGLKIDTNLLSLLPQTERDPVLAEVVDRFTQRMSNKTLFVVGHEDEAVAADAADALAEKLRGSGLFSEVSARVDERGQAAFELYFPFRYQLLANGTRTRMNQVGAELLIQRAVRAVYQPTSALYSRILEDDPLLLFPLFLEEMPKPPGRLNLRHGFLGTRLEGTSYILISADLVGDAFSRDGQKRAAAFLDGELKRLRENGVVAAATGVVRYAAAGSATAEGEISTIGLGSLLGVVLLFLMAFGRVRPLLLGLLPIASGVLTALVICFAVFGRIHIITLGFGASLIGICIDYTFHYFCEFSAHPNRSGKGILLAILPAISLGALTSIMGYLGLFAAPFPGLRQMALFSSSGLLGAFATVVLAFPYLSGAPRPAPPLLQRIAAAYLAFWRGMGPKSLTLVGLLVLLIGLPGLWRLRGDDDIRRLQTPSPQLQQEEGFIRTIAGSLDTSRFLLVEGADPEAVLVAQEKLYPQLAQLRESGALGWFQGLSELLPSKARQQENHLRLRHALRSGDNELDRYLEEMGFSEEAAAQARRALDVSPENQLDLPTWLESTFSAPLRHLWLGETARGCAAMVVLGDIKDAAALEALVAPLEGVHYIDKVDDISRLMARYRVLGSKLVALSYLAIFLLLLLRYGLRRGLTASLPPIAAAVLALAAFGLWDQPITLFHVLALLLVLGIGIDYTIFFAEVGDHHPPTMLAVKLSACTTVLSFGLLALSETPVLRSFGLTVGVGIVAAWLLAPLAGRGGSARP